jgi:TPR repeat protein
LAYLRSGKVGTDLRGRVSTGAKFQWRDDEEVIDMRFTTSVSPAAIVAVLVLGLTACADVKETLSDASAKIDSVLGSDAAETPATPGQSEDAPAAGETAYRAGLAARAEGRESDAFRHFLDAAEQGHPEAAYEVGLAYTKGVGVEQDNDAAAEWLNKAAAGGEPRAQYLIGVAYYNGLGVEQDYETAAAYLGEAAVQGHADAQFLLAQVFATGNGVRENRAWATRWYGKAAQQGHADAQFHYGVSRASGLGLPANPEAGYGWLLLAERGGHGQAAEVRAALNDKLSAEARTRAETWADAFDPVQGTGVGDLPTVMYVQHALNGLGYDAGPVDGLVGPRTRQAIGRYRQARGLAEDAGIAADLLQQILTDQGTLG